MTNNDLQNTTQKTNDLVTRTLQTTEVELRCFGREKLIAIHRELLHIICLTFSLHEVPIEIMNHFRYNCNLIHF